MEYYCYNSGNPLISAEEKAKNPPMLTFLRDYLDPIALKYNMHKEGQLSQESRALAAEYESNHQFGNLSKQEYSYMMENLRLVYGNGNPEVEDDIIAYHLVEKKIIYGYLGIPQLSRMFDEDYFNFEWDMHVGQNFREHRNNYYRDHFIHQIRNLHMMINLLDKFNFDEACSHIFHQRKATRISGYVYKCWKIFEESKQDGTMQLLEKIWKCENRTNKEEIESREDNGKKIDNLSHSKEQLAIQEYQEKYFYQYVVYASSILAALFHDMGYPICHFLELRHRTSAYNPAMYMFTHNAVDSFDQIAAKLGQSLLFTIVPQEEIRKRLEPGKGGKYEHGAYSAIAFLLQFYETGLIHSIGQDKKCAIEMAALAIYNHTVKFQCINRKSETKHFSMMFFQNPISFLLRFCDDLQEWDRRYFVISEASDFMFCPTCGMPLLRNSQRNTDSHLSVYSCGCKEKEELKRPDIFAKRKLFLVTVADWVRFRGTDNPYSPQNLRVSIHYDLYKLLILTTIHNEYAKYRLNDLKDLEKLVENQNFYMMSDKVLPINEIKVDYFMSANPICIKIKILEEYLSREDWEIEKADERRRIRHLNHKEILTEVYKLLESEDARNQFIRNIRSQEGLACPEQLVEYLKKSGTILFYLQLLYIQLINTISEEEENASLNEEKKLYSNKLKHTIDKEKSTHHHYYKAISMLVDDCLCKNNSENRLFYKSKIEDIDKEKLYYQIKVYTDSRNYFNLYGEESKGMFGFFNDLYLFYLMNAEMKWPK